MINKTTKVVSIRAPIKLLNAITQKYPEASTNQSAVLIQLLRCGHYYRQYQCQELASDILTNGSIKNQVDAAYWRGLIHMLIAVIAASIAALSFVFWFVA